MEHIVIVRHQQAYFIGSKTVSGTIVKASSNLTETADSVLVASTLSHGLIPDLSAGRFRAVLLGYESPFSHVANVLRLISTREHATPVYVLGIGELSKVLKVGTHCRVVPDEQRIDVNDISYLFPKRGMFVSDDIAISIGKPKALCYRPFYLYHPSLAALIMQGYELLASMVLKVSCETFIDSLGQVWVEGLGFPSVIATWALSNPSEYIGFIAEYGKVLKELLEIAESGRCRDAQSGQVQFADLLRLHYAYSPLVGFPVAYFAEALVRDPGFAPTNLEWLTNYVASLAPTANPALPVQEALSDVLKITAHIRASLGGQSEKDEGISAEATIQWPADFKHTAVADLMLLASLYAEIRRSVVSALRKACPWFKMITAHREKIDFQVPSLEEKHGP